LIEGSALEFLTALLTPCVAIFSLLLSFHNHQLAKKRRKDELFDRRYSFYKKFLSYWETTYEDGPLDIDDLQPIAQQAEFLFGKDISEHILSFENKSCNAPEFLPSKDFYEPFVKYLKLDE
jgi:hypothetical protein